MKINDRTKKILTAIPIVIIGILFAYYIDEYFESPKDLTARCMKGRGVLLNFMNEAKRTGDSATLTKIIDSCQDFISGCPNKEIDSLRSFIPFFIKLTNDYSHDVANAIKDSGEMDTLHLLRPTTVAEIKQLCIQCNYNYSDFGANLRAEALAAQKKRNTLQTIGTPVETTELFRRKILAAEQKKDSAESQFYKRAFSEKQ